MDTIKELYEIPQNKAERIETFLRKHVQVTGLLIDAHTLIRLILPGVRFSLGLAGQNDLLIVYIHVGAGDNVNDVVAKKAKFEHDWWAANEDQASGLIAFDLVIGG